MSKQNRKRKQAEADVSGGEPALANAPIITNLDCPTQEEVEKYLVDRKKQVRFGPKLSSWLYKLR